MPSLPVSEVKKDELSGNVEKHLFCFERGSQFDVLSENPMSFMWVSPITETLLERWGLVQRECVENDRLYRDMLIHRKNYELTDLDTAFIDELKKSKERCLDKHLS